MSKEQEIALSKRELDIMNVLWAEGKPLIASEIPSRHENLSINTVQAVLKKLLHRGFIEIAEIVQSGTVLSRSYAPIVTPEEYAVKFLVSEIYPYKTILTRTRFLDALFENADNQGELIETLEKMIGEKKTK
ncbi:MAG: BlaI/MecI/CopY family transcriptional regulator [Lachnospiraceae bacterium]|nr:BlaI/MecI/CopY family transcriptional regulator [Lachnospiraceae bacterium]